VNDSIQDFRRFYAKFIVASAGSTDERLIAAFSTVPREKFLGKGPWPVFIGSGYLPTISNDPRLVYQDIVIGLLPEKGINNGQPGLHARCIGELAPSPGESVIHIGAGTGYYTAVLAEMVGGAGVIDAYEVEAGLAERATAYLEGYRKIGGRMAVPITPNEGFGGMLMITRRAASVYAARILCRVAFISCAGNRSDAESVGLAKAFEPHSFRPVKSFHRFTSPDETAWFAGNDWWLSTAEPASIA